jgi:hypothetical protein
VPTLRLNNNVSCKPNSEPNSKLLVRITSAISTSILTIGGRRSRASMTFLTSSNNVGTALTMIVLLIDSGTTMTCWA